VKTIDTLIISGASITQSPWFTWADIVIETIKPKKVIDISSRGVGNYYINLSCINAVLNSTGNVLCMPMFTNIDKFDLYLNKESTQHYVNEKHRPIGLSGQAAHKDDFSFWSTGSHWPLIKQNYLENFFDLDIACTNNIFNFFTLENLCRQRAVDLVPLFDSQIWNYLEKDLNQYVIDGKLIQDDFTQLPLTSKIKPMLDDKWYKFESLIQYAINHNLEIYSPINKLHPPSNVHLSWMQDCILPQLQEKFVCRDMSADFLKKIQVFSQEW
jgi:hypothetical protein